MVELFGFHVSHGIAIAITLAALFGTIIVVSVMFRKKGTNRTLDIKQIVRAWKNPMG